MKIVILMLFDSNFKVEGDIFPTILVYNGIFTEYSHPRAFPVNNKCIEILISEILF
jgi:hypothetical protein